MAEEEGVAASLPGADTGDGDAPGAPGMPPRWTRGAKDAVGTAYSVASRVWFTMAQGTLTEIYFPNVDRPQVRDLQYLFSDGVRTFLSERRDCESQAKALAEDALGFHIHTRDRGGRFELHKELIADPHLDCVLLNTCVQLGAEHCGDWRMYVLCAPHLGGAGWHNMAEVDHGVGRTLLLACRDGVWLALGATIPFAAVSCGYVGGSDGWTGLSEHFQLRQTYPQARDGNVALTGELDLSAGREFTLGLAFGATRNAAVNTLLQSLRQPFAATRDRFLEQWRRACRHKRPLHRHAAKGSRLYDSSVSVLLAHEDKGYAGAIIAALSIPWGEVKGDDDLGGYHLVWTRDLVQSASALMASGDRETPLRALVYLAASQRSDGGFAQNFWVDGRPYWQGIQLDEVAFPIMLAWQLHHHRRLGEFDPTPMVLRAAGYLMRHGPATPQERWEESGGYSPSTLAVHIAALVCAAEFARRDRQEAQAALCLEYADFLEAHLESWTVTRQGTLVPGVERHYIRINPAPLRNNGAGEDPDTERVRINNRGPGEVSEFWAREIVDAGFLQLVRYGVRPADDPLIVDSLKVVDAVLKRDTPLGPAWRRYNHDGYGQRANGDAFNGWGQGRPWPLLTGERGHYELAAGRDARPYLHAMERFASPLGLLPEQVWDQPDIPEQFLRAGGPTGAAMPLAWAHAEYIRLLRSIDDGAVFSMIPAVAKRYANPRRPRAAFEIWKFHRQLAQVAAGTRLRVQARAAFFLRYSLDEWSTIEESRSTPTGMGFEYFDVTLPPSQTAPLRFTFRWVDGERWEGRDFTVAVGG